MAAKAFLMAAQSRRAKQEPNAATARTAGVRPITAADVRVPGASLEPLRRFTDTDGRCDRSTLLAKHADAG